MRVVKLLIYTVAAYVLAAVLFPWCWLTEQKSAIRIAYLDTFRTAHIHVKNTWAINARAKR